ncbi:MAG: helix-turn-helix domain-containing protein [Desulfovibrionales bacterium]|nr:helix-turn-helix domain-containing protein [Desulfovibrionales bacterium]
MKQKSFEKIAIPTEGEAVELKESVGEWKEIVKTCAAFATAHGGRIFIGVADNGQPVGVQIGKGTLEDLTNKIVQNTNPKTVPAVAIIQRKGKIVITLDVPENPAKPVYAFDKPLRRSGRTNQTLSPAEAADLYFATRGITWDETILDEASLQDINVEKVRSFLGRARNERRLNAGADTPADQVLRQLNLIRDKKTTIAAILLFGKEPERLMPQSALRCARFKGDDTVHFLDMKVIEGSVIDQVEEAMAFVRRNTSMAVKIEGKPERTEQWEYPLDAVREAITNAVCHRDYADSGNVQVRIFDHGLEVWNPGTLPAGLTVDDLRRNHESKPRNKLIARMFFLIRYIEQFGTGTGRMIEECRMAGIPEPEFESRGGSFRVVFRKTIPVERRFAEAGLNERQLKALSLIAERGQITLSEFAQLMKMPKRTLQRDIQGLLKKGLLVKRGTGKTTRYEPNK